MLQVKLVEYVRPNGDKRWVSITVTEALTTDYALMRARGVILETETLMTGEVALYSRYANDEDDCIGISLVAAADVPLGVRAAIENLIKNTAESLRTQLVPSV